MIFAEVLSCTGRIEVAQTNKLQSMDLVVPPQDFFESQLRFALRTSSLSDFAFATKSRSSAALVISQLWPALRRCVSARNPQIVNSRSTEQPAWQRNPI